MLNTHQYTSHKHEKTHGPFAAFQSCCKLGGAAKRIAHALKGVADNLGATEVQHSAAQVEAAIANCDFESALALLQGLALQ